MTYETRTTKVSIVPKGEPLFNQNATEIEIVDEPTPETDAKASPHIGFYSCATVPAEFARQLERERDEARERCAKFRDIAERAVNLGLGGKTGRINGILSVEYFKGIIKAAFKGKVK